MSLKIDFKQFSLYNLKNFKEDVCLLLEARRLNHMANFIKTKGISVSEQMHSYVISRNVLLIIGIILMFIFPPLLFIGLVGAIIMHIKIKEIKQECKIEKSITSEISRLPKEYDILTNLVLEYSDGMLVHVKYLIIGVNKMFIIGTLGGIGHVEGSSKDTMLSVSDGGSVPNPIMENKTIAFALNVLLAKLNISRDPILAIVKEHEDTTYRIDGENEPILEVHELAEFIYENDGRGFWITPDERKSIIQALKGLSL